MCPPKPEAPGGARAGGRPARSLKAQALAALSRREYSRQELRAKLLAGAASAAKPAGAGADANADADLDGDAHADTEVDLLLDWLVAHGYLSDARFVESRLHARASRHGSRRIRAELSRHGVTLDAEQAARLRETEFARAQEVWRRKFGTVAPDLRGRAAQARFLTARGFAADVVRRLVGGEAGDECGDDRAGASDDA